MKIFSWLMLPCLQLLFPCSSLVGHAQTTTPSAPVWTMQDSGTTASLRGIRSVDGKIAWASGSGGTVLKTVDGGAHWIKCEVPDEKTDGAKLDFRGVQGWDADIAILLSSGPGELSRVYKTTDGCKTWILLITNHEKDGFWDAISEGSSSEILLGDPVRGHFVLWQTSKRNLNEFAEPTDQFRYTPRARTGEGVFAASNSALFVENPYWNFWFATGGKSGSRVIRRINHDFDDFAFNTFPSSPVPVGSRTESSGVFSLYFREEPHVVNRSTDCIVGIAVGGDYAKPNESSRTSAWSSDSGKTWTASITPPHGYRSTVQWSEALKVWITAGTNGSDVSRDDGKTWTALDDGNWNALSLPFIVGPGGRIGRLNENAIPPINPQTSTPAR